MSNFNPSEFQAQYVVHSDNREYNGRTLGIKFEKGEAQLTPRTIQSEYMQREMDEVALAFLKDVEGFTVHGLTPEAQQVLAEWEAKRNEHAPAKTGAVLRTPKLKKNNVVKREGTFRTEQ